MRRSARRTRRRSLDAAAARAALAGVEFIGARDLGLAVEAILAAARKHKCDAIVMASQGRRGVSALLLGSETQKVLTHSKVPVIVVR
jgi:nucleotide-binding universal stress UspA family protein